MEAVIQKIQGILLLIEVETLDKVLKFIGILSLALLFACGTKEISRSFNVNQVSRLLNGGDQKAWQLIARKEAGVDVFGGCIENNSITFVEAVDSDSLYILGKPTNCGSNATLDTLYKAKYVVDGNSSDIFNNTIDLSEEKRLSIGSFQIGTLTSSSLNIIYTANGNQIEETYSF